MHTHECTMQRTEELKRNRVHTAKKKKAKGCCVAWDRKMRARVEREAEWYQSQDDFESVNCN